MRLRNKQEIPIELWQQACGDIENFVGKKILNELCKGIADIIANGGEYIIHMTDAEITSKPMTNSIMYQQEIQYDPVVRCKDCRWFKQDSSPVGYGYCDGRMVGREVDYNDYCSHGERREE